MKKIAKIAKHINRITEWRAPTIQANKASVELVRSDRREGDSQTVRLGIKGMQGIEEMLRSMQGAQEKLVS